MNKSRSEKIFDHALKFATPFRTTLGHAWAIIPDGPGRYHGWPISSHSFRKWLAHSFHREHSIFPGPQAVSSAVGVFEAHALHSDFPVSDIFTRVGWRGDPRTPQSILLHLANANNELIEITPQGRRVVSAGSWHFLAGASTDPLPRPVENTATLVDHLRPLLNLDGPALDRVAIWLFAALRPVGPYPVLVLTGAPGSGKSTLARTLRNIIDPSATSIQTPPANDHDLFTLALHNHVLAFDNVSSLPRRLGDSVARLATGAGLGICGRNIFDHPLALSLARPLIVTASADHREFTQNALYVEMNAIASPRFRSEKSIAKKLEAAAPFILGTLCSAVTSALANTATVEIAHSSRFADVQEWTMAASAILGLTPRQIDRALAATPLVDAIHALLEEKPEWSGTASDLLKSLHEKGFSPVASDARHLSLQLNSTPLSLFGIELEKVHTGEQRIIRLTQTPGFSVSEASQKH